MKSYQKYLKWLQILASDNVHRHLWPTQRFHNFSMAQFLYQQILRLSFFQKKTFLMEKEFHFLKLDSTSTNVKALPVVVENVSKLFFVMLKCFPKLKEFLKDWKEKKNVSINESPKNKLDLQVVGSFFHTRNFSVVILVCLISQLCQTVALRNFY